MAFEKPDSTQICTWAPPLPQRAFQIQQAGVTSDSVSLGGTAVNGQRYGYFLLNTTQWQTLTTMNVPPMNVGERFQLYTTGTAAANKNVFGMPAAFAYGNVTSGLSTNTNPVAAAPDLYNVTGMIYSDQYALKDPTLCAVVAVRQNSTNSWYIYFAPYDATESITLLKDGIVTVPEPSSPRWLGQIGHVSGINYTYALPGGPDQLTCVLQVPPDYRTDAMNPGRILTAYRGGGCIWEGILTEPAPSPTGWTLTANGAGTYGTNFAAWWQIGDALSWNADRVLEYAIARGLRWNLPGINNPPGLYLGPVQESGSMTITDFMNLLCTGGALTWQVTQPAGASTFPPRPWDIRVFPLPSDSSGNPIESAPSNQLSSQLFTFDRWSRSDLSATQSRRPPDLYIVNTNPMGRTITADYNTVVVYYQVTADTTATSTKAATSATYQTTYADIPQSVAQHGRLEYFLDVSSAGVMTQPQASQIAVNVLTKYVRANFSGTFTVQPGQLLNVGGFPVDLGCNWGGYVASVQVETFAYGGEVAFGPVTFQIGEYAFDDDTQTATVTPYQSARTDISSVIAQLYPGKFS